MLRAIGRSVLVLLALCLVAGVSTARPKPAGKGSGGGTTVVNKWDWTVTDEEDKFVEKGRWIVKGFVIFNGQGKRVGSFDAVSETHVKVEITEGRLTGKIDLHKEKDSAINWKGELDKGSGHLYKISVALEKAIR